MNKGKNIILMIRILVLAVLLLTACGKTSNTEQTIKIAVVAPLTGSAASYGDGVKRGFDLAVEEVNASGGIDGRQVVLEYYDDKCDAKEAANIAQRVVADGSFFAVFGSVCSSAVLASMPIYEEAGMTVMISSATNPQVTNQGWTHIFRTISHDGLTGPLMAELVKEEFNATNIAIFYAQDDFGRGLREAVQPKLTELGLVVVAEESYVADVDKDFSAPLTRISQANPEVILFFGYPAEGGMIVRQAVAAGLGDIPFVLHGACQDQQFLDLAGDAANGVIAASLYDPYSENPLTKAFNEKWDEKYGELASDFNAYSYELVYILKEAVEAGATSQNLSEYLADVRYEGPTGLTVFDATGQAVGKLPMPITVKDGKWATYNP